METYLTIEELAVYLKLAEQTIRRWVLNREVPYRKIKKVIRFRVSEIEKWIDDGGKYKVSAEIEQDEDGLFGEENEGETVGGLEEQADTETAGSEGEA